MPLAARQADIQALTQALSRGAVANSRKRLGKTALLAACYGGHVALVQRLSSAGAGTAPLDRLYKPAIVYAAGQRHAAVVALLDPRLSPAAGFD